jgi:hypothetical protein
MISLALEVLTFVQAALLFAALPLSVLAAYGFHGTPWGRVLSPLPVVELTFAVGLGIGLVDANAGALALLRAVCFAVGVLGVALITFRLSRIARGGVQA